MYKHEKERKKRDEKTRLLIAVNVNDSNVEN